MVDEVLEHPDADAPKPPPKKRGPGRPRKTDKAPKPRKSGAQQRQDRKAADIRLIREGFAELLSMPGMLAAAKGDVWAVDHFTKQGPKLADRLAAECERNTKLRQLCVKMLTAQTLLFLGVEAFFYIVPALMHYGIVPGAERMGVPVVAGGAKQAGPRGAPPSPPPAQQPEPEEPEPEPIDPLAAELAEDEIPPMPVSPA